MIHKPLTLFAAVVVSSGVGAGVAVWISAHDAPVVHPKSSDIQLRLDAVVRRLDALEASRVVVEPARRDPSGPSRSLVVDAARDAVDGRLSALESALAHIEQRLGSLSSNLRPQDASSGRPVEHGPERLAEEESRQIITDPSASESDKLKAWASLRFTADAYTDEVVAQMVLIGLNAVDPVVRADVWRQADGSTKHEGLVPALLQALQVDPVDSVREEAAETLVEYVDRPHVLATIQQMLVTEQHKGVRGYLQDAIKRSGR